MLFVSGLRVELLLLGLPVPSEEHNLQAMGLGRAENSQLSVDLGPHISTCDLRFLIPFRTLDRRHTPAFLL